MRYVYVLDQEGRPLMPTSRFRKVRRMLKAGQARAVSTLPFTIQLMYRPKTQERQAVVAGIDPGRTNIGLAAVREDGTCLYQAHGTTRNKEIVNLMSDRLASRRASRRGERLARKRLAKRLHTTAKKLLDRILPGCREPLAVKDIINTEARFNNRLRPQGWLTPSATQLLRTHVNLLKKMQEILPVSDVVVELNRFAFLQLDQPGVRKKDIDFTHGALYGTGGLHAAVRELQQDRCLLCREGEIEHFHHIIPRSRRGSDTLANLAGLCERCHELVHKHAEAADRLRERKNGLEKRYGGTSVLNQIIPTLMQNLGECFPGHAFATTGWKTKEFREAHELEKDHAVDAYSIAGSILQPSVLDLAVEGYEILQFRRHSRANINHQTERTYLLDNKTVAKNRRKRMDQKTDSLQEWYEDAAARYGEKQADRLRSRLTVKKSTRYYNSKDRLLPGTVFSYEGKRYVLTGQLTGGAYYRAYGQGKKNFPAKKVRILCQNEGLVYAS